MESKNISLIIGTLIPFLMIVLVAGSIYIPGIFIQPQYDFLYALNAPQGELKVVNGVLARSGESASKVKFFIYNVRSGEVTGVSFEEASLLKLDPTETSPDGFSLTYGSRWKGTFLFFFFSGKDYTTMYLKGRNVTKRLRLPVNEGETFQFLGWVMR